MSSQGFTIGTIRDTIVRGTVQSDPQIEVQKSIDLKEQQEEKARKIHSIISKKFLKQWKSRVDNYENDRLDFILKKQEEDMWAKRDDYLQQERVKVPVDLDQQTMLIETTYYSNAESIAQKFVERHSFDERNLDYLQN